MHRPRGLLARSLPREKRHDCHNSGGNEGNSTDKQQYVHLKLKKVTIQVPNRPFYPLQALIRSLELPFGFGPVVGEESGNLVPVS